MILNCRTTEIIYLISINLSSSEQCNVINKATMVIFIVGENFDLYFLLNGELPTLAWAKSLEKECLSVITI